MNRRNYLRRLFTTATAASLGSTMTGVTDAESAGRLQAPPVAWRRTYDQVDVASVAPAHGDGYVVVNRGQLWPDPDLPVEVAHVDDAGQTRRHTVLEPDVPDDARRATADLTRTEDGYLVATGPWFARLDTELSVQTIGSAPEVDANYTTKVADLAGVTAIARDRYNPQRQYTKVLGFGRNGDHQWNWQFGKPAEQGTTPLGFLLNHPDGGIVVGGSRLGSGKPWLARLGTDGTERWRRTVTDAPAGTGADGTLDGERMTLLGRDGLLRLENGRSIDWQRSYDQIQDRGRGRMTGTADGGYVVVEVLDGPRVVVLKTDTNGALQWSETYQVAADTDPGYSVRAIEETAPGEFLVAGVTEDGDRHRGWAVFLSDTFTPPPTTSPTPTASETPTTPVTAPPTSSEKSPTELSPTTTTVPGFGVGAALAGVFAGALVRRWRE